jgi:hypothetical protein
MWRIHAFLSTHWQTRRITMHFSRRKNRAAELNRWAMIQGRLS